MNLKYVSDNISVSIFFTYKYLYLHWPKYRKFISSGPYLKHLITRAVFKVFVIWFIHFMAKLHLHHRHMTCLLPSLAHCSLVSWRTFYSSPGSRWLTVHDLQHWMINSKRAHFIHRPAYLLAAHWYSCWKCGERHSWMYGCRLYWRGFDIELSCLTAILLTEATYALGVRGEGGRGSRNVPADWTKCCQHRLAASVIV